MDIGTAGRLRIDLGALVANYAMIAEEVSPAKVAGVVKADAYGLGAIPVARALIDTGCRHLCVAHLGEADELKPHITQDIPIFVLNGLQPGAELDCVAVGAIPVLNSLAQIEAWASTARALGRVLPGVLQFDSGMARLGLGEDELAELRAHPGQMNGIALQLVMSHLACADAPDDAFNQHQRGLFNRMAEQFPGIPRSLDNSGGALMLDVGHGDLVRTGIALYGGAPHGIPNPMHAVVSLDAYIIQIRAVPAGGGVGYGLTHHCEQPSKVATISVGYADGWPRALSGCGSAYIAGIRVPIIGRVSMDSMALDVTAIPDHLLQAGASVELLGPHQTIDEVAAQAGTISYEILTRLGRRYARDYLPAAINDNGSILR